MMKNILVLTGGGDNDEAVFATALAAAQPFHAHLEFLHVQIGPGQAAAWEPRSEFLRGSAIREGDTAVAHRGRDAHCICEEPLRTIL
jgi:hypothetical protein